MRYLLIDRVELVEFHQRIRALKNVALTEDYFSEHFVGRPVVPGALLIESMAQAGTVLLELSSDMRRKALLVMVEHAKFRAQAKPGDQLVVEVRIESHDAAWVRTSGEIRVKDRVVTDARLTFSLTDADAFYPGSLRSIVELAYRNMLEGATIVREAPVP